MLNTSQIFLGRSFEDRRCSHTNTCVEVAGTLCPGGYVMEKMYYSVVFWAYKKDFVGPRAWYQAMTFFDEATLPCKLVQVVVGDKKTARIVCKQKGHK